MPNQIDQRHKLEQEPFQYRVLKDQKIEIIWQDKPIMMLKGQRAQALIKKLDQALNQGSEDDHQIVLAVQLILAKETGHFKHGNEKQAKAKRPY